MKEKMKIFIKQIGKCIANDDKILYLCSII